MDEKRVSLSTNMWSAGSVSACAEGRWDGRMDGAMARSTPATALDGRGDARISPSIAIYNLPITCHFSLSMHVEETHF
jgi:hypothetical protein